MAYLKRVVSSLVPLFIITACGDAGLPPRGDDASLNVQATAVTATIPSSPSDAEEHGGSFYNDSAVLELGEKSAGVPQLTGLRFAPVAVPRGATVTGAKISFVAVADQAAPTSLSVRGEKVADAPESESGSEPLSSRPGTTAVVSWTPGAWTGGAGYSTADLKNVVQELVNQPGWASGNAMAFVITGTGLRKAGAYDGGGGNAARLSVTYEVAPPPSPTCPGGAASTVTAAPTTNSTYRVWDRGPRAGVDAAGKLFTGSQGLLLSVKHNEPGLCISGGKFDMRQGDDEQWHNPGYHDHFAVVASDSPGLVLDSVAVHQAGDAFSFKSTDGSADNWTVRDSYVRHAGDDFVENDAKYNGLVDDVLVDWAYMGVSCRKDANPARSTPGTVTIRDSLIALKKQVGTYGGLKPENPSHLFLFKFEQDDLPNCKLRLRNTVFYLQMNHPVFKSAQDPTAYVTECRDVTLVYAGSGSYTAEAGRLAALRDKFGPSCFRLEQGAAGTRTWEQERRDWFARHAGSAQISAYRNLPEPRGAE